MKAVCRISAAQSLSERVLAGFIKVLKSLLRTKEKAAASCLFATQDFCEAILEYGEAGRDLLE